MLNVVVADCDQLYREAVVGLLKRTFTGCTVSEVISYAELKKTVNYGTKPKVVLLDLELPGLEGFAGQAAINKRHPDIHVIAKYKRQEPVIAAHAYDLGAAAFVHSAILPERLVWVIRSVAEGKLLFNEIGMHAQDRERTMSRQAMREQAKLTEKVNLLNVRQIQVLVRLTEGKLNKQIADDLNISLSSVKAHMKVILRVLDVRTRTHAALIARKLLLTRRQLDGTTNPISVSLEMLFEQANLRKVN